jgi:hypothetical protein
MATQPATVPIQTAQWVKVCAVRCSEPLEEPDKDHLGTDVGVDRDRDKETGQGDAIGDLLYQCARRPEGRVGEVLAAVVVDDDAGGEVGRRDDGLAGVDGPVVVLGPSHLTNDVEKRGRAWAIEAFPVARRGTVAIWED